MLVAVLLSVVAFGDWHGGHMVHITYYRCTQGGGGGGLTGIQHKMKFHFFPNEATYTIMKYPKINDAKAP